MTEDSHCSIRWELSGEERRKPGRCQVTVRSFGGGKVQLEGRLLVGFMSNKHLPTWWKSKDHNNV